MHVPLEICRHKHEDNNQKREQPNSQVK